MIGDFSENLKEIIIWDKIHGQPAMQKQVLNRRSELLLVFDSDYPISRQFRNNGYFDRGTLDDVWEIPRQRKDIKTHTYIGASANFIRRLKQHNCKTPGGPRITRRAAGNWVPVMVLELPSGRSFSSKE